VSARAKDQTADVVAGLSLDTTWGSKGGPERATRAEDPPFSAESLAAIQRRMAAAVMAPLTTRWAMARRRPGGGSTAREAEAFIRPNDRLTAFERLEIYNRQYWFRILDCLADDFPGLESILGSARCSRMARAYLAECPSTSFTLRNLGSRLEAWLRDHPAWLEPRVPLALDMVRLEWAHIEAFDREERPALAAGQLPAVAASTRFALQPHLILLRLSHPVDDLLIAVRRNAERADTPGNGAVAARNARLVRRAAAAEPEPIFLAVHRHDHNVYYKRLDPEGFRILEALQAGAPLGDALEAGFASSQVPEAERAAYLRRSFHHWAALGWFTRPAAGPHPEIRP